MRARYRQDLAPLNAWGCVDGVWLLTERVDAIGDRFPLYAHLSTPAVV